MPDLVAEVDADVLVVGGGLAALRCALEARRSGANVAVAVKGRLGRSGSSAMTSAGYSAVVDAPDDPALHSTDTLTGGRGLNNARLVDVMASEAPARLRELVALGAPLALEQDGSWVVHPSGDHTVPRTVVAASFRGLDFTLPLAAEVERIGCTVLERTMVLDVLADGGDVHGAIALRRGDDPGLVVVRAPAVVLATGGAGQLFSVSSNPSDVTGDGYAIALRAGCALRDMEFIQFYPWRCIVPFEQGRMPIQPSTFVFGARLLNSRGERFMLDWDPERVEATTRDVAARAIYEQIRTGAAVRGGVRLDLTQVSDADWRRSNPRPADWFDKRGLDVREQELIIAPEAHFFMGGVVVDEHGRSSIGGLFAAGETAGGVHGANRLDSNAIPETQVFGARAGRAAAAWAAATERRDVGEALADWRAAHASADGAGAWSAVDYQVRRRRLQALAWDALGIVRDATRLTAGLAELADLHDEVGASAPADAAAALSRAELDDLLLVGAACMTAALERAESRGAHFRSDFPERDDGRWQRPLVVRGAAVEALLAATEEMAT
jgi:fumarate reductase (CoM/CoB) subunit A